jgi:hypothetical protein
MMTKSKESWKSVAYVPHFIEPVLRSERDEVAHQIVPSREVRLRQSGFIDMACVQKHSEHHIDRVPPQLGMTPPADANVTGHPKSYWISAGEQEIRALLKVEHAVVRMEIESKIAEKPGTSRHIQPHILADSLRRLVRRGEVATNTDATRGGRDIVTFSLSKPSVSKRLVERAAARKRLLQTRYLQWATGTAGLGRHTGIVGPSLEKSLHASILTSAPYLGYRMLNPVSGEVSTVWDFDATSFGSPDNGFLWHDADTNSDHLCLVEAKNTREWIYPWGSELYQLLFKCAHIYPEALRRGYGVIPVLVCRKASPTLYYAAKDLGFHVAEVGKQLVDFGLEVGSDEDRMVNEVRAELGFTDILDHNGTYRTIEKQFKSVIPGRALEITQQFAEVGQELESDFRLLRVDGNTQTKYRAMKANAESLGAEISWW